jgi:hypothetical protein
MSNKIGRMAILALTAAIIPACGNGPQNSSAPQAESANTFADKDIETFPNEGQEHVPVGTVIVYQTDPPTSGPHYPDPEPGGFYTQEIAAGFLVHSMEHGAVIIYYSPAVTADQLAHLQDLANQHPGIFAQVVVVPRNDATYPIILTAWTHRLRLTTYDASRIDGFLTLFLNKGPEQQPM